MKYGDNNNVVNMAVGSTKVKRVFLGETLVHGAPVYEGPPSPVIIDVNSTIVAGIDFPADVELNICMIGGGGGGGYASAGGGLGGGAGVVVSDVIAPVEAGLPFDIVIGAGLPQGSGGGTVGGITTAFGFSAGGGVTFTVSLNGEERVTCAGTATNGIAQATAYGGEAGLGNGGNGSSGGSPAGNGVRGGGGGGKTNDAVNRGGGGGNGEVILTW